jgi:glutamate-1-semialdehyde 2,1-aminomutase
MPLSKSARLYNRSRKKIPGGVNSPVRAWQAVGGSPLFMARGVGSYVVDIDGKRYIDFVGSWGPLILGHAHPRVTALVQRTCVRGMTFGAPTEGELRLAESISRLVPSIEKVRLVVSGTEATMSALRLARAFTKRPKIVKFDGCYHGHADGLLVRAGSGVATFGLPDSPGVPATLAAETLVAPFNDLRVVGHLFERYRKDIAAVIVEPVCGNMGVIPPAPGFLQSLRTLTHRHGALLIFDEVITGFRVSPGGAQRLYRVPPDMTCLGKILGGGLPLAAFGGRAKIMDHLAPEGPVYQAGTLAGNPLAVAAGLATLERLARPGVYTMLEKKGRQLQVGFDRVLKKYNIKGTVNRIGSMMTLFFGVDRVQNADDARRCDRQQFRRFFHGMLRRGFYFPPAPFETAFVSLAHSSDEIEKTVSAFADWASEETQG